MCDVKTIQRDCIAMQKDGIVIPTRGQQKDIGPGVTHRELVVRHWIEGKEPVAVAECTKHSIKAVENYLDRLYLVSVFFDFFNYQVQIAFKKCNQCFCYINFVFLTCIYVASNSCKNICSFHRPKTPRNFLLYFSHS